VLTARRNLRNIVLWAMIPLTLFASRPVMGCTCADGTFKLICFGQLGLGGVSKQADKECIQPCCRNHPQSLRNSSGCSVESGYSNCNKSCCSPEALISIVVAPVTSVVVDTDLLLPFDLPTESLLLNSNHWLGFDFDRHDIGLPVSDLVIVLHRLLI